MPMNCLIYQRRHEIWIGINSFKQSGESYFNKFFDLFLDFRCKFKYLLDINELKNLWNVMWLQDITILNDKTN